MKNFIGKNYTTLIFAAISFVIQITLLRELLTEVNGNEIVFPAFIAFWLISAGIGDYFSRFLDEKRAIISIFVLFFIAPLQFLLIRHLAEIFAISGSNIISAPSAIAISFLSSLPLSFLSGFIFNLLKNNESSLKVRAATTLTGVFAGTILFFALVFFYGNFTIISASICLGSILIFVKSRKFFHLFMVFLTSLLLIFSPLIFSLNYSSKYEPEKLINSIDSTQGRVDITKLGTRKTYQYNSTIIADSEDEKEAEELAGFFLMQHQNPENILIIGGLLKKYPEVILKKLPGVTIDYLEIEPVIMSKIIKSKKDRFINLLDDEPLSFLKNTKKKYDIIFTDIPDPFSVSTGRFYTYEFFQLIKSRLNNEGIAAISTTSEGNLIVSPLTQLSGTIFQTLEKVFTEVKFIPASRNIFVAGGSYKTNDLKVMIERMRQSNLRGKWFNQSLIEERCNELRMSRIARLLTKKSSLPNTNLDMQVYLSGIQFWAKKQGLDFDNTIESLKKLTPVLFSLLFAFMLAALFLYSKAAKRNFTDSFGIFSVNLASFSMMIMLINILQTYSGNVYILMPLFFLTSALGLFVGFHIAQKIKSQIFILFALYMILVLFIYFTAATAFMAELYFVFNLISSLFQGLIISKLVAEKEPLSWFTNTIAPAFGGLVIAVV